MSPLKITMLLHVYAIAEPIPNYQYPAQSAALEAFLNDNLIKRSLSTGSGYEITEKGKLLIDLITSTADSLLATLNKY